MTSTSPTGSAFPASMGPGGQPRNPQQEAKSMESMLMEISEMRKKYTIEVEPTTLKVGYLLNGARRSYDINWDAAPLSGLQKWICYGGRGRALVSGTFLLDMLRGAENMTGRPMSQPEAEAFTRYSAKRMTYGFMGTVVALGSGYALAWRGSKTMKFPFRKPKPLEAYDIFPMRRMPLLTGTYARSAWQVTRANIYAALGLIFLSPLFRGMGESVMAVGLYNDHRTRETVKAMKGGFDRIRMNRSRYASRTTAGPQSQQSADDKDSSDFYDSGGEQMQSYHDNNSDYAGDVSFSNDTTNTGVQSETSMHQREARQGASHSSGVDYSARPSDNSAAMSQRSQSSSSSGFFFDDTSPTAGNDPDSGAPQPNVQGAGPSNVWARIRRGGQAQPTSTVSTSQSPTSQSYQGRGWPSSRTESGPADTETRGDSFSFSTADSNRAVAKEQAQKEFDAMLDKERKESGSNEYERSSFATEAGSETPQTNTTGSAWERRRRGG